MSAEINGASSSVGFSDGATDADVEVFAFGPFRLFPSLRLLERSGEPAKLGGRAFDLLVLLVSRACEVVSQREIHAIVWSGLIVDEGSLRFHISALRKALGDGQPDVKYVVNVPGRGYCFVAPVTSLRSTRSTTRGNVQAPRAASHRLPPKLACMVGRGDAVRDVGRKLLAERFVTIIGPGGMGKTTVAVAVGHAVSPDFAAAVHFVDLGRVRQPDQVAGAIALAIGLQVRSEDPVPDMLAVLRNRHVLLILDSCEHVLDATAAIAEQIFRHSPEVFILATSRESLEVEGEHVFKLPPLHMPPDGVPVTAEELMEYSAPQLFVERARAGGAQIKLSDADVAAIIDICRKLDGMALAIELAAGRVQAYGIQKTAALLGQQFSLLWPGRRTALPRHQTLMATLDWSYNLLCPPERRLLHRLSAFIGTFDLEAVGAVAVGEGETPDRGCSVDVASLVSKSLAVAETVGGEARYRLLDTTRTYAFQKLADSGELWDTAHRHAAYYERVLVRQAKIEERTGEWPQSLAASLNDIRAAMDWAMSDEGDARLGVRLAAYSASMWLGLGVLPECRDRMAQAMRALDDGDDAPRQEQMLIQMALGAAVMFTVGLGDEFRATWTKALSLAEELGDIKCQLTSYLLLWAQEYRMPSMDKALAFAQRCVMLVTESGRAGPRSMATWMLGLSRHQMGQLEEARRHLEKALATDEHDDRLLQIRHFGHDRRTDGLGVLSNVLLMQGHPAEALETSALAVAEARQLDYPVPLCIALSWHSFNLYLVGADWTEVESHATALAGHAQGHGVEAYEGFGLCVRALSGRPGRMVKEITSTVATGTRMLTRGHYGTFNGIFQAQAAMELAKAGLQVQAEALFATAESEDRNPDHWCRPEIVRKGELALVRGKAEEAEHWFKSSMDWAARHGALAWQLRAANSLANLWITQERAASVGEQLAPLLARCGSGIVSRDMQNARELLARAKTPSG